MPNIEIHGFGQKKAKALEKKIFLLFGKEKFVEDMVVSILPTIVRDIKGKKMPFVRLTSTPHPLIIPTITRRLRKMKLDVEVLTLDAFYPASEPLNTG